MSFSLIIDGNDKTAVETARQRLIVCTALFGAAFLAISGRLIDLAVIQKGATGPQLASRFVQRFPVFGQYKSDKDH